MSTEISVTVRRAVIETNLERCRDTAAKSFVEIGRWLNAAKDEGVVGHGEWEQWVLTHAGLKARNAQRCMQIAREVPEGSMLEGLEISKVRALLALPAGEREDAAREMDAANATAAAIEEKVRAIRAERDEALRLVGAQKREVVSANKLREETTKRMQEEIRQNDAMRGLYKKAQAEVKRLEDELELARANVGASPLAQARIDELERKLSERENEIDQLTDRLDEAQTQAARGGMASSERRSPYLTIISAIGALLAEAGNAPGELERMQGELDEESRNLLIGQAGTVGTWAMRIIAACGGELDDFGRA